MICFFFFLVGVVTQFFLRIKKNLKIQKYFFSRVNLIFSFKPCRPGLKMSSGLFRVKNVIFDQNRVHQVNTGQTMLTSFKNEFRVKNVIFDQNRVHQVNTGKTMSTSFKNEFRAVSGQICHFRPKPSSPGQTMSTRFKNEFRAVSGQKRYFRLKPSSPGQYGSNHVDRDEK